VTASKPGFIDVSFGAKRPGRPGTPIQLLEGQRVEKVTIAIPRGGVITGVVVDENGEPAPGTQVRAMRFVMRTGERTLAFGGQDQTDDRRQYRIYGKPPGEYIVSAITRNMNPATDMRQLLVSQAEVLQNAIAGAAPVGRGGPFAAGNLGMVVSSPAAQDAITQLAQQLGIPDDGPAVAYAPIYYPGSASP